MLKTRLLFLTIALLLGGCLEVLSIPSISLNSDASMMAFLVESDEGQSMALHLLSIDSGRSIEFGNPDTMKGAFDWHPSEPRLAYIEIQEDYKSTLQIADIDGEAEEIMVLPDYAWVSQIAYSPDGNTIALSLGMLPPETDLGQLLDFTVDFNPSEVRVILVDVATGEALEIVREEPGQTASLAWNPSKNQLAYGFNGHVYVYDMSDEKTTEIRWADFLSLRSPSWLNDNTLLMLSAADLEGEGPDETEIVRYDMLTTEYEGWLVGLGSAVPTASPNGQYIAYLEGSQSPDPELSSQGYATAAVTVMLLDIEAGSIVPLYVGVALDRPVWSPDSETLYISNGNAFSMSVDNPRQIFAVDVATGAASPVYEGALATSSLLGWFPPQEEEE